MHVTLQVAIDDVAVKAAFPAAPCLLLGRDLTRVQYDALLGDARERRQLDLAELGAQLSEGGMAELGALCPEVQAVFCPRSVRP